MNRTGRASAANPRSSEPTPKPIIADLLSGQFNDPVRVIAFNTLEHWSQDVSRDIAAEIQTRCDIEGAAVPEHVEDFVHSHTHPAREQPWGRRHGGAVMSKSN